jgi:EmrB/QacA subfamily drug resistance transporter
MTPRHKRAAVAGVLLGLFLSALESTVVTTAMPTIVSHLGGLSIYSWVFSGYLLSSTVTMPLWGRLSDLYGRRRLFLCGVSLFLLGSALCGLSHSMTQLIAFRFIQGFGAGGVLPLTFTIIGDIFSLEQRAKMQGLFSGVWGVASLVGPLVGGILVDQFSWRWIFYLNLPFGLCSIALILWGLAPTEALHRKPEGSLDALGTFFFAGFAFTLLCGLTLVTRSLYGGLALFALSALLLVLYILGERHARHPLIPLKLFSIRMYSVSQTSGLFTGMAMFGTLSFVPLFMQSVLGSTATEAGRVLVPFMLSWVAFSIVGSRLILELGYRGVILTGSILLFAGFSILCTLGLDSTHARVMIGMAFQGAGMGFLMAPFMIAIQSAVPKELMGAATSSTQFVRTIGGAVGVSLMGTLLSHHLKTTAEFYLSSDLPAARILGQLLEHPDAIVSAAGRQNLTPEILRQVQGLMAQGLHKVFLAGCVFSFCAFLACLWVPGGRAHSHVWKPGGGRPS